MRTQGTRPIRQRSYAALGAEVTRLRVAKGWEPEDLARRAGVSRETVVHVENGERAFLSTLQKVAKALVLQP
jgi:transcriptional regulator with XRE-family HTH domain